MVKPAARWRVRTDCRGRQCRSLSSGGCFRSLRSGGNNVARPAVIWVWAGWRRARVSFCWSTHTPLPRSVGCIIAPVPRNGTGLMRRCSDFSSKFAGCGLHNYARPPGTGRGLKRRCSDASQVRVSHRNIRTGYT